MDKKTDVRDPDEKVVEIEMERLRAWRNVTNIGAITAAAESPASPVPIPAQAIRHTISCFNIVSAYPSLLRSGSFSINVFA